MAKRPSLADPPAQLAAEPDLSSAHKRAIEGALRWAWQQLVSANDVVLNDGSEEAITAALETQLGRMEHGRRVAPGLKDFDHPVRGAKQCTSDGRIEKQPDLTFRPPTSRYQRVTNTACWGCFVECKLIEDGHASRTVESYSDKGIRRFAIGEYAARMPSAMMIAFVRGNKQPAESLEPLLPLHGATTIARGKSADTCSTQHPRIALFPSCADVNLIHLWLLVPTKLAA
ncbi:hypothetical protein IP93_00653 [Lysobacter ruishenii]|uniref:Uncharacterized protein n=2 Tax=Aerolutibacter ruishenii TaxID=686800 RepID=A0A562M1K5_9GAMM|nr:hypothetical protein IP93_00653 [Lysobacter ruishenii]